MNDRIEGSKDERKSEKAKLDFGDKMFIAAAIIGSFGLSIMALEHFGLIDDVYIVWAISV